MSDLFQPPDMSVWRGRVDDPAEGADALRWHQRVQPLVSGAAPPVPAPPGVALLGFACDAGVRRNQGRPGAAEGPRTLRAALSPLAWHQNAPVYDAGDVACVGDALEEAQEELAARVAALLRDGHRPLILGGGHETAWGTFQGISRAHPGATIGILNLDTHFDVRTAPHAHSGTPFAQAAELCHTQGRPFRYLCLGVSEAANTAALFSRADALGVRCRPDTRMAERHLPDILAQVETFAASVDALHLSLDLDVLSAADMPAVSAPAAMGVAPTVIDEILRAAANSGKVAAAEVVEYCAPQDECGRGARLAARLVWSIAQHWK